MDYLPPTLCADTYTDLLTLGPRFQADHANIQVGATVADTNEVLYQVAQGTPGDYAWTLEREFSAVPQTFKVANIVGVRFRNKVAGQQATVQAYLLGPKDPDIQPGTPFARPAVAALSVAQLAIVNFNANSGISYFPVLAQAYAFNSDTATFATRGAFASSFYVAQGGIFRVTGRLQWPANANGDRWLDLRQNGTTILAVGDTERAPAGLAGYQGFSTLLQLNPGDYLEMLAEQTSGTTLTTLGGSLTLERMIVLAT